MSKNITVILIDDELDSLNALEEQIKLYCPGVKILGAYDEARKGLEAIRAQNPDVVFLDIQMPGMTGLELAKAIGPDNARVIFVTAYSQYALDAIKLSALDYLLKPVDPDELIAAVEKIRTKSAGKQSGDPNQLPILDHLLHEAQNQSYSQDTIIGLPDEKGINYIRIKDIIRLEAQRNYCMFYFLDGSSTLVSKNIGTFTDGLQKYELVQVHRAHVVNLKHVKRYVRVNGPYLQMCDGSEVPVSKGFKDDW